MRNYDKPIAWQWDQATTEGDWQTAFSEYGEPQMSPTVRNITPLYAHPPRAYNPYDLLSEDKGDHMQEPAAQRDPAANLTPEQFRYAQFMGGIGDEEWD